MSWKLSNFAKGALVQACTDAATTIYISAAEALLLPTLGVGDKAKGILYNSGYAEIVNVTAVAVGGGLTVERAQENTSARDWEAGTKFIHTPTAEIIQLVLATVAAVVFVGTATGTNNISVNVGASNPVPGLNDGEEVSFVIAATNTGTLNLEVTNGVSTTTQKPIVRADGTVPAAGEFAEDFLAKLQFTEDVDSWRIVSLTSNKVRASEINTGPVPAVNRHRNGRLDYWRGGTLFSTPASATETADGFVVLYDGTIGVFAISRQEFTLGQTDVPDNPKYFFRWDQSSAGAASTFRRVRVRLPGVQWRAGKKATYSVWMKADAARSVTRRIVQYFGSGGAPSADVTVSTAVISLTTDWQEFSVTVDVPSIAGKTLGSGGDDAIDLYFDLPINVSMTIDIANADLRPGDVQGFQSDSWPVPWWLGGTGGSYDDQADFLNQISASLLPLYTDLALIEALTTTGLVYRNNTGPAWGTRVLAAGTGLLATNTDGVAGNPTIGLDTVLANYQADPMSVAELASITAVFGTAAFVNTGTSGATIPLNNSNNTFSGDNTFTGHPVLEGANPHLCWNETDQAADEKRWDVIATGGDFLIRTRTDADGAGVTAVTFNRGVSTALTDITFGAHMRGVDGTAALPYISPASDPDTGFYSLGANQLAVTTGGTLRWYFDNDGSLVHNSGVLKGPPGTAAAPGYTFAGDTNLGMYRIGADNMGFTANGALIFDFSATRVLLAQDLVFPTAQTPTSAYSGGYRGLPVITSNATYAFPLTDAGHTILHDETTARTWTIPANGSTPHPVGTTFVIDNTGNSGGAPGAITLQITTDTLRRGDGVAGTGTRTIPANGVATVRKTKSQEWVITGIFT